MWISNVKLFFFSAILFDLNERIVIFFQKVEICQPFDI